MFTDKDIAKLKAEIDFVIEKISTSLAGLIIDDKKVSFEAVVLGLLKIASVVAVRTKCPRDIFIKLANIAFDEEEKVKKIEKETSIDEDNNVFEFKQKKTDDKKLN